MNNNSNNTDKNFYSCDFSPCDFPSCDFHFIAIGGVGQSALAKILLCLGYKVSGSDIQESKYTKLTQKLGAKIYIGHKKENIKGTPKVVISSAIKEDNPELIRAKELNLEIMHRSDCLKYISELFPCFIGFAGTHGKTTTSGLMSFVLEKLNQNPSYAIGGIIPTYNINANADKNSKYFIAELDESDGTIQKYKPQKLVINNLEADHLDYYKNGLEDIIKTFEKTASNMDENSKIFVNIDNLGVQKFLSQTKFKNIITYSINSNSSYQAKNIIFSELSSSFEVYKNNTLLGKINLIIPGLHNIYNALSVVSVLDDLGFKFSDYCGYFSEFSGMGRRFQLVYDKNGIKIIDDYAHHPSEIKSTLSAVKDIKKRKVVIFQPHRYTRLKALWAEFLESFNSIDILYILDVFCAGDKPDETYNSQTFTKEIQKKGLSAKYVKGTVLQAAKEIALNLKEGDLVLTLGAGDVTEIAGGINDMLSK